MANQILGMAMQKQFGWSFGQSNFLAHIVHCHPIYKMYKLRI